MSTDNMEETMYNNSIAVELDISSSDEEWSMEKETHSGQKTSTCTFHISIHVGVILLFIVCCMVLYNCRQVAAKSWKERKEGHTLTMFGNLLLYKYNLNSI
jgi:hypothetical protein